MNINKIILRFVSISFSIMIILLIILGLIRLGNYCYEFGYRVFTEPAVAAEPGTDVTVYVTDTMSEWDVSKMMEEKGLVKNRVLFFAQLKLSAYSGKLLSGTYTLNTSMVARDMMQVMSAKPVEDTEETESDESAASLVTDELTEDDTTEYEPYEDDMPEAGEP